MHRRRDLVDRSPRRDLSLHVPRYCTPLPLLSSACSNSERWSTDGLDDPQARSSFGTLGAYAPILVRSILALLWLVILTCASVVSSRSLALCRAFHGAVRKAHTFVRTDQGGGLVVVMLGAIWPSFLNIKNTLPEDLGITTQGMVGFLILWLFQAPLACVPIRKLALFLKIKVCQTTLHSSTCPPREPLRTGHR